MMSWQRRLVVVTMFSGLISSCACFQTETYRELGKFSLQYKLFTNETFSVPYTRTQYPVVRTLRQPLSMEVSIATSNVDVKMNLRSCFATPSSSSQDVIKHWLIKDSCPNDRSFKQSRIDRLSNKFTINAFQFQNSVLMKSDAVYFHCTVIICLINEDIGPCQWKPDNCAFHNKRRRRGVYSFVENDIVTNDVTKDSGQVKSDEVMLSSGKTVVINPHSAIDANSTKTIKSLNKDGSISYALHIKIAIGISVFIGLVGVAICVVCICLVCKSRVDPENNSNIEDEHTVENGGP